ncbi:MAG: ATP-binding cassette domain-containing protein [Planctomycetota bacterium]|nr:ATP-binding cassette domain-containing protein [Planctomycetota bacterium]
MIELDAISIRAGTFRLDGVSLQVSKGGYTALMGRTGSGKTTLLEAICGLRGVESGSIRIAGQDVTHARPSQRGIGYVPQDLALFPTMTVARQLALPLSIRRLDRQFITQRVDSIASLLGIGHLLNRRPAGLSGGELQRVALGRALSFAPPVLCLDEPLSALDDETREEICRVIKRVQEEVEVTVLHVTHSLKDAQMLADVTLTIRDGTVVPLQETTA